MIGFFRRIRKKLADDNQFLKYSRYAVGEIVLVVIGILIAVQINSWYTKTKENKLKAVYTENLINDLTKDTIQLQERVKENEDYYLKRFDSIFEIVDSPTTTLEDIKHLGKNKGIDGLRTKNTYNVSTFNVLVSTGNISLFEDGLIQKIMELNRLQNFEIAVSENNSKIYFDMYNNYLKQYIRASASANNTIRDEIWAHKSALEHAAIYIHTIETLRHCVNRYIELSQDIIVKTEELLDLLKISRKEG